MLRDGQPFRPWGNLSIIISGYEGKQWAFIGCATMEDRCSCVYSVLSQSSIISNPLIFRLQSYKSHHSEEAEEKTEKNFNFYQQIGVSEESFEKFSVNDNFSHIKKRIRSFLDQVTEGNLLIDITAMPKKLIFYIIKLVKNAYQNISNVIVTYTEPAEYGDGALAENQDRWAALPGFQGPRRDPSGKKTVIAIGYEPLGLPDLAASGEFENGTVALLFPFPTPPHRVAKNWTFTRELFPNIETENIDIQRVDAANVPEVFDVLTRLGSNGETFLTLAPFGPKPISLAMALYATKHCFRKNPPSVFYTQPKVYNPDYTRGVKILNGLPSINAYCIRLNSTEVY